MLNKDDFPIKPGSRPSPEHGTFDLNEWREQFILVVLRIIAILGIVLIVTTFPTATPGDRILYIGMYAALLAITVLRVSYPWRAAVLLVLSFSIGINATLAWGPWKDGSLFLLTGITLAAVLYDRRVDLVGLGVVALTVSAIAVMEQNGMYQLSAAGAPRTAPADWTGYIIDLVIAGMLIAILIGRFKGAVIQSIQKLQAVINSLAEEKAALGAKAQEQAVEIDAWTNQLRASTNVARAVAGQTDVTELLDATAKLISEKFGHYHAGVYILDEQRKNAFLQSASSAAGRQLIGRGFQISSDRQDLFNRAINSSLPVGVSDSDRANFVKDENFPLTRSRMILPLALRGKAIGLVDIHSDQPQTFTAQDAETLQILADFTAISFDNIRLANETKSLIAQLEATLSIQTQRSWSKLTSHQKTAYQYTPAGVRPMFSHEKRSGGEGLRVPLVLHGQQIGAIKLSRKGDEKWSERERALLEKIAEQVSLALENSRLVDEAQKNALRDQMIANVSTRIRETLDVEGVIRNAATELRRVFDLREAEIVVGTPTQKNTTATDG